MAHFRSSWVNTMVSSRSVRYTTAGAAVSLFLIVTTNASSSTTQTTSPFRSTQTTTAQETGVSDWKGGGTRHKTPAFLLSSSSSSPSLVNSACASLSQYPRRASAVAKTTLCDAPTGNDNNDRTDDVSSTSDRLLPWSKRWAANRIRFHHANVHPVLYKRMMGLQNSKKHMPQTGSSSWRVLVPLCGKTVDIPFLAAQSPLIQEVVGVEGVRKAIDDFCTENPSLQMTPVNDSSTSSSSQPFTKWTGQSTTLLMGDYFDLNVATAGGKFDVAWDRASMVAIEPSLRSAYVDIYEKVMKPGGQIWLVTVVRTNGDTTTGPPYSIDIDQVRELFENRPWVESVEQVVENSIFDSALPWFVVLRSYLGLGGFREKSFLIKVKS